MRRILDTSIALLLLLTACSAPVQQMPPSTEPSGDYAYGVYEFTFDVERLSGWPFEGWDFVYTYNGEQIQSGHPFSNGDIYYHPDEDKAYLTPSGAFKAVPYDVVKAYCSGWTGYLTGVDTHDFLEKYARDFDVPILTQEEYESLDEEDWKMSDNSYRQAWEKVIETMADALIDSWHSLCTARGIQLRKGK